MRTLWTVAVATVLLAAGCPASAAVTAQELIRQSLENFKLDHEAAPQYTYKERDLEKNAHDTKVSVSNVVPVNGLPYEITVSRNDQPLVGDQAAREQAKLAKRKNESAADQEKRQKEYRSSMQFLNDVPNAFDFRLTGQAVLNGRNNYVVECSPKSGFVAREPRASMFAHIAATLWIDQQDIRWAKAKARVLDTISIGWILARIGPGATMELEQTPVGDKHWLPSLIDVSGNARVLLIKDHPIREHITYYDFKPVKNRDLNTPAVSR